MVMSRAGNRSLKIRSERIGNTGSGKTYSVKRGPKLQEEVFFSKKANGATIPKASDLKNSNTVQIIF
jgi:hypothetical protein